MAKFVEEKGDKKFPNSIISKTPFLSSVRDYCPEGVKLGVERVSKLFAVKQEPSKAQLMAEMVIQSDMPKCRCHILNDDGEYVTELDELTGKSVKKLELRAIEGSELITFPIFFPCGKPKEISNDAELTFYPTSSAYPLFKLALQEAGELPEGMGDKAFVTTQEELKECLEGFEFIAKCEEIKGKFNYLRLDAVME